MVRRKQVFKCVGQSVSNVDEEKKKMNEDVVFVEDVQLSKHFISATTACKTELPLKKISHHVSLHYLSPTSAEVYKNMYCYEDMPCTPISQKVYICNCYNHFCFCFISEEKNGIKRIKCYRYFIYNNILQSIIW